MGSFDFTAFTTQVHDFDLGIQPDGLFWTTPKGIPAGAVSANPGAGSASMSLTDLTATDFHSIPNALFLGAFTGSEPATVSFEVHWGGVTNRGSISDATNGFALQFVMTDARVKWSATNTGTGFSFTSDVASNATSVAPFNMLAHEQNGAFFGG